MRPRLHFSIAAGFAALLFSSCLAPRAASAAAPAPAPAASDDSAIPAYDKFVKGADLADGIFPLVRKDGKVYMTLSKSQLDTDFYEHATIANGLGGFGLLSGDDFQQPARIIRFERIGDSKVSIVMPQYRLLGHPGTAAGYAVQGSAAASVLAVMPVVAEDKDAGKIVVDPSFLLADNLGLGNQLSDIVKNPENPLNGYHLDPARTYFGPSKAFPKNDIIEADETFASDKPDPTIDTVEDQHSVQMRVKYNFAQVLSSPDYMPRLADDRVGYWEDPHVGFDSDDSYDDVQRFVTRWDIRASDPTKPSPAVKPIVYTLSNTIPPEYHAAIRDALLEWNKAFARIGILDAVQVQDQPNDPNFDPDDIRYNTIRWLTEANGGGFAEAQIEWDPRTGEIFRSGILLDSDLMRFEKLYYGDEVVPESGPTTTDGAGVLTQLWDPAKMSPANRKHVLAPSFLHRDTGAAMQAEYAALALTLYNGSVPSSFSYDFLKSIVLHESGHDFGLAHNFIGHNAFTAAELKDPAFTKANGVASSVMEYAPTNLWPKGTRQGSYFQTTIGPYDYHVIHWGYAPVPGATTPQAEVPTLDKWASAATDPKYRFASDEDVEYDGHAVDPRVSQWMLTGDSISWCTTQMSMTRGIMETIDSRYPKPQMPWDQERLAFRYVLSDYGNCSRAMAHYIGGEYLSRARRGDPGSSNPLTPVPRTEEVRAFANLDAFLFGNNAWHISSNTLRRLTYSEYEPMANLGYNPTPRHDLSLAEIVAGQQNAALGLMFAPLTLARLADMPTKAGSDKPMTLADLFTWTQQSVFTDLASGKPDRTLLRHNLQRNYTRMLEHIAFTPSEGTPYDAQALALHELVAEQSYLKRDLAVSNLDLETRAHLEALASEVHRSLDTKDVTPLHD
jgi:hypothetical protein